MWRWALRIAAALVALPVLYLSLALLLGLIPVNRDFRPPAQGGVTIYLRTNGVHADLVLPAAAPFDWRAQFPLDSVVDRRRVTVPDALNWIAFGWGDRGFYVHTPTWSDLRFGTAAVALLGLGSGAMHVEYLARPQDYHVQRVDLQPQQYDALTAALQSGFARDANGRLHRIDAPGYFATDAFYEGTGRYTLWLTCNEWIRRALASAGVRTAVWAPFDEALFWHLR
jgi:uncharacterized protein (TIGR02117 family)